MIKDNQPDEAYPLHKDNRKYHVYKNDLKYRKYRGIDSSRIINYEEIKEYLEIDMDSLEYRIKECLDNGGKNLDLSHMELHCLPDNIPKSATFLCCSDNMIESLDKITSILPNLEILDCHSNRLSTLPYIPGLKELVARNNRLEDIDLLGKNNKLEHLDVSYNSIRKLPFFKNLRVLECGNNKITSFGGFDRIQKLSCEKNRLCSIEGLRSVEFLDIRHNQITRVAELENLTYLLCSYNRLKSLHSLPRLEVLYCEDNRDLTHLHYFPNLEAIFCDAGISHLSSRYDGRIHQARKQKNKYLYIEFKKSVKNKKV